MLTMLNIRYCTIEIKNNDISACHTTLNFSAAQMDDLSLHCYFGRAMLRQAF